MLLVLSMIEFLSSMISTEFSRSIGFDMSLCGIVVEVGLWEAPFLDGRFPLAVVVVLAPLIGFLDTLVNPVYFGCFLLEELDLRCFLCADWFFGSFESEAICAWNPWPDPELSDRNINHRWRPTNNGQRSHTFT